MKKKLAKLIIPLIAVVLLVAVVLLFAAVVTGREIITFEPSDEAIANPLMGYAPSATNSDLHFDDYSLIYIDVTWRESEPTEGVFDFAGIDEDNSIAQHRAKGRRAVFRFVCDVPGEESHLDIPDWLYEKTADGAFYESDSGFGYSPNYENPVFIAAHAKVIAALGEYYGQDDFFYYIELGSIGHWGEWHVKTSAGCPPIPKMSVCTQYLQPYKTAFPNAYLLMRRPFTIGTEYNCGVYNDMLGHEEATKEWIEWIRNGGEYDQNDELGAITKLSSLWWDDAPSGGELTSSITMTDMLNINTKLTSTVTQVRSSHATFIGPKTPYGSSYDKSVESGARQLLQAMGYRLRVSYLVAQRGIFDEKMTYTVTIANDGVAPMFASWQVCLYIVDDEGNIVERRPLDIALTDITTEADVTVKEQFKGKALPDSYRLCIGIEDPATNEPAVRFAMEARRIGTLSVIYTYKKRFA